MHILPNNNVAQKNLEIVPSNAKVPTQEDIKADAVGKKRETFGTRLLDQLNAVVMFSKIVYDRATSDFAALNTAHLSFQRDGASDDLWL